MTPPEWLQSTAPNIRHTSGWRQVELLASRPEWSAPTLVRTVDGTRLHITPHNARALLAYRSEVARKLTAPQRECLAFIVDVNTTDDHFHLRGWYGVDNRLLAVGALALSSKQTGAYNLTHWGLALAKESQ